jgi:pyruvate-formate lyase-activating enzyme
MLESVAGITHIRMLYLQLLYRCNFSCKHCFHGDLLASRDAFTAAQATAIIDHFQTTYFLQAVTLLGGEPLLYPDLAAVARHAKTRGLGVEICTNGHPGFRERLRQVAPYLDKFRVSLDGLAATHDFIRQRGSFDGALHMIDVARGLGILTGATMTVTERNLDDVVRLAKLLQERGVTELKLHCLRIVGNATSHADMQTPDPVRFPGLHDTIQAADLDLTVLYDSDLSPAPHNEIASRRRRTGRIDRIESDPRGGLTFSCKASGHNINSFRWDKENEIIRHEPKAADELTIGVPDVTYRTAAA